MYDIIHPLQQSEDPRDLRLSPFHARLVEQQGIFFANAGWEVAQWYEANASLLKHYEDRIPKRSGWAGQNWSPIQGAEHLALRDRVGLVNMTTLATVEVSGAGAVSFLDRMAANRVDRPIGRVIYTSLLTPRGGIKCDLTLVRRAEDRFWVFTGGAFLPHDLAWLRQHAPTDGSVHLVDLSSSLAGFGLWGPHARQVLQTIVEEDVSNEAFPYYTAQTVTMGHVPVYALRVSYAGELGWEIHAPTEYAAWVWDRVWQAGLEFGILAAGAGAFDSLRLEKGYRLWGADIHTEYNPLRGRPRLGGAPEQRRLHRPGGVAEGTRPGDPAQVMLPDAGRSLRGAAGQGTHSERGSEAGLCHQRQLRIQCRRVHRLRLPTCGIRGGGNLCGGGVFW